jgi:hypothetical protein
MKTLTILAITGILSGCTTTKEPVGNRESVKNAIQLPPDDGPPGPARHTWSITFTSGRWPGEYVFTHIVDRRDGIVELKKVEPKMDSGLSDTTYRVSVDSLHQIQPPHETPQTQEFLQIANSSTEKKLSIIEQIIEPQEIGGGGR